MPHSAAYVLPDGFWGELQCQLVYYADADTQRRVLERLPAALAAGDLAAGLEAVVAGGRTGELVRDALPHRGEPGWEHPVRAVLEGVLPEIEREAARRRPLNRPADIEERARAFLAGLADADPTDVVEVAADPGGYVWVNYVSRRFSPRYDGAKGDWDRDTQYMFELHFGAGLFVWLSVATAKEFQGQGVGTRFLRAAERFAADLGFRRFAVIGPLNGPYWEQVMGYAVQKGPVIHYLEGYKEV